MPQIRVLGGTRQIAYLPLIQKIFCELLNPDISEELWLLQEILENDLNAWGTNFIQNQLMPLEQLGLLSKGKELSSLSDYYLDQSLAKNYSRVINFKGTSNMETYDLNSSPCLLVIGAREHTLKKLRLMAIKYILIQSQQEPLTEYLDEKVVFISAYENFSEISQVAEKLHQAYRFKAVVSFTEYGLYPAALIAEQLNLKGNTLFPVQHTRDKFKMRLLLEQHCLASITFHNCLTFQDVVNFYEKTNAPFILKPSQGAGSQGVCYVDSFQMIASAWSWALQCGNQELIAEEYCSGKEYSVETLSLDGQHEIIAITEKFTTEAPHFIELGHRSPAPLTRRMQQKIHQIILRFLDVIQHQDGPTHTEIKVDGDKIKIIESQTRMGGDQIWEMTELTTGVDVISETVIHLLGLEKQERYKKANAAAILFFAREFEEIVDVNGWNLPK